MRTAWIRVTLLWLAAIAIAVPTSAQAKFHYRQGGQLEGVFFLDGSQHGWTAEDGARIRNSENAGATWTPVNFVDERVRGELRGIQIRGSMLEGVEGHAVGDGGVCLRSTDGNGQEWDWINEADPILDANGQPAELWDIFMITSQVGWSVGMRGALNRTLDGGETWSFPSGCTPPDLDLGIDGFIDLYKVHFFNAQDGIIAGDYARILKTNDAGCTWTIVDLEAELPSAICPGGATHNLEIWDLAFDDPNDPDTGMWAGGGTGTSSGYLFRSEDGGESWTQSRCFNAGFVGCGIPTIYALASLGATSEPSVFSGHYGSWVMAYEPGTANYNLCNCTATEPTECEESLIWNQRSTHPAGGNPPLSAAAALSSTEGCIVGRFGIIRLFDTQGSPDLIDVGTTQWSRIGDGDFISDTEGCVITQAHIILRTDDAGVTWFPVYTPTSVDFSKQGLALDLGGANGMKGVAGGTNDFVAYTTNEGASWTPVTVSGLEGNALGVGFVPGSDTVYLTSNQGQIFRSTNYGMGWTDISPCNPPCEEPCDPPCTTPLITGALRAVSFAEGGDVGYVAGNPSSDGMIHLTYDAGESWTGIGIQGTQPMAIQDIATWGDGSEAIAVAAGGRVFERNGARFYPVTVDLSPDPSPTADLMDVEVVVDGTDVYVQIVGAGGLVLFPDPGATGALRRARRATSSCARRSSRPTTASCSGRSSWSASTRSRHCQGPRAALEEAARGRSRPVRASSQASRSRAARPACRIALRAEDSGSEVPCAREQPRRADRL